MNKKLKITLSTTIGLIIASIIPLSVLNPSQSNSDKTTHNINTMQNSNSIQTVANVDEIKYYSNDSSDSMFAIVKDAVKGDRLYAWGSNFAGQLGLGTFGNNISVPTLVPTTFMKSGDVITSISTHIFSSALVVNGKQIYTCGANVSGQLGNGSDASAPGNSEVYTFTRINLPLSTNETIININMSTTAMASTSLNKLYIWGQTNGLIPSDNEFLKYTPQLLSSFGSGIITNMGDIFGGVTSTVWALVNNELYMWGGNRSGELGIGSDTTFNSPQKTLLPNGAITQVVTGKKAMFAIIDGEKLYGWGENSNNTFGQGVDSQNVPYLIKSGANMKIIASGTQQSGYLIISYDGKIYAIGENSSGQLGLGNRDSVSDWTLVNSSNLDANTSKYMSFNGGALALTNGKFYAWGDNSSGKYGEGTYIKDANNVETYDQFSTPTLVDPFNSVPSAFTFKTTNKYVKASVALSDMYPDGEFNVDRLKTYVDGFQTFPSDTSFTLKGYPDHDEENGIIALTVDVDKYYTAPDGTKIISTIEWPRLVINNFLTNEQTTEILPKSAYNVSQSSLNAFNDLKDNFSIDKLEEYVDIFGRTEDFATGLSINQDNLINPIDNVTGTLKFNVVLTNYYDENGVAQSTPKPFPVTLEGFIKDSSVSINETGDKTLVAQVVADSFKTETTLNIDNIKKYITLNFNYSLTELTAISTVVDKTLGTIRVTLTISNYYQNGVIVKPDDILLENFNTSPTSELTKISTHPNDQSAKVVFDSLVNSTTKIINQTILAKYVSGINTFPNDTIFKVKDGYSINNTTGTLTLTVIADKWFDYGEVNPNPQSFDYNFFGFIKNSNVEAKTEYDKNEAAQTIKNTMINEDGTFNPNILQEYVDLNFNNDARTTVTKLTGISNNQSGTLMLTLTLNNYYEDGELVPTKDIPLSGFDNSKLTSLTAINTKHLIMAQTAFDSFVNADTLTIDQTEITNYVAGLDSLPADTVLTIESGYTINNENNGSIEMIIVADKWYDYSYLSNTSKKFPITISGFIKNSIITPRDGPFEFSPRAAYNTFADDRYNIVNWENLEKFVNLDALDDSVDFTRVDPTFDSSPTPATMTLRFSMDNFYENGALVQQKDITISGFIPDSSITYHDRLVLDTTAQFAANSILDADGNFNRTQLDKYISIVLNSSFTKITRLTIDVDKELGIMTLNLSLEHYYRAGKEEPTKTMTINGFKIAPNTELTPKRVVFGLSAKQAFESFTTDNITINNLDNLKKYVDGISQTLPTDAILTIEPNSDINNDTGTITMVLKTTKYYDYGDIIDGNKSFELTVDGFITNSSIEPVTNVDKKSATQIRTEIIEADASNREGILAKFTTITCDKQAIIDWSNIETTADDSTGMLSIKFNNLVKFYVDGEPVTTQSIIVDGFITNTTFIAKSTVYQDKSPQLIYDSFAKTDNTLKSLSELEKYVDLGTLDSRTKINSFTPNFDNQNGTLELTAHFSNAYENGQPVTTLKTTINQLAIDSVITVNSGPFALSAKAASERLINENGNVLFDELTQYVTIVGPATIKDLKLINVNHKAGTMTIKILFSNTFVDSGKLLPELGVTISGFIKDSIIVPIHNTNDKSATEIQTEINNAANIVDKQNIINEYVDITINSQTIIDWTAIDSSVDDTTGKLTLTFNNLVLFYNDGDLVDTHTIDINGFITNTTFIAKNTVHQDKSPQLIYDSFAKPDNTLKSLSELEKYVDLGTLDSRTKINSFTPNFDNQNGTLELTAHFSNAYENGQPVNTLKTTINQLAIDSVITVNSGPFTLSATKAFESLKDGNGNVELNELKKYITIVGPAIINDVQPIVVDNTKTSMTIKLLLSNTFSDEGKPLEELELIIDGFIKDSSITQKTNTDLKSATEVQTEINSAAIGDKQIIIEKYAIFNLDLQTIIDWTAITSSVDNTTGQLTLNFNNLTFFNVDGLSKNSKTIIIDGFITDTVFEAKTISHVNISPQQIYANFASPDNKLISMTELAKYVDLGTTDDRTTITSFTPIFDNENGTLELTAHFSNGYQNGAQRPSLTTTIEQLTGDTNIASKDGPFLISAKAAFANLKDANGDVVLTELDKYISIVGPAVVSDIQAIDINDEVGSMTIQLLLSNSFTDKGKPITDMKMTINGFTQNSVISAKELQFDISAQQAANEINDAKILGNVQVEEVINKYFTIELAERTTIDWNQVTVTNLDASSGTLSIKFGVLDNFYQDGNVATTLEFNFDGFIISSTIPDKTTGTYQITAKDAADLLVKKDDQTIDINLLRTYTDLQTLPANVKMILKNSSILVDAQNGSLNMTVIVDSYYEDGQLKIGSKEFSFTLDGFIKIESKAYIVWTSLAGVMSILVLLVFGLYLNNNKLTNKKIINSEF